MIKKNILIATELEFPHQGGVSSHIELLIKGLSQENKVWVISRNDIPKIIERLVFLFSGFLSLINRGLGYYLYHKLIGIYLSKIIKNSIAKNKIDILHVHSTNFAFTKAYSIPSVLTCHADITNEMIGQNKIKESSWIANLFLKMELDCYTKNNLIIAVDERLKKHVLSIAPLANVVAMINFIDPYEFDDHLLSKEQYSQYKIPENKKIILCPRRMVIKNGVIYSVKIIEKLPDSFHLLIIGGGEEFDNIKNYLKKNKIEDRVTIIPGVDRSEMAKFYNASTFVIIPSITVNNLQEATSISALEGMACTKVVVASKIGGLPLLIQDAVSGILFEETRYDEAVRKISSITPEQYKSISLKARERVIELFGYEQACNKIINYYKDISRK